MTDLLTDLACFVFALYNALSVKAKTNTWYWHAAQYAVIALFMMCGFEDMVVDLVKLLLANNWHDFGISAVAFLARLCVYVGIYVFSLHRFLEIFDK